MPVCRMLVKMIVRKLQFNLLLLLLALLVLSSCPNSGKGNLEIEEYTVKRGSIRESVICDGALEPHARVEIKSKASGILEFIGFDEGDLVREGDLMFRLDKSLIKQRVLQARARLTSAKAELALAKRNQSPRELIDLENAVAQAKFNLEDASARFERIKELYEREFATKQELDDSEASLERARLTLELAQKRLDQSNTGGTEEEIQVAQARVLIAQADLSNALEELSETEITSPIVGVVLSDEVEVGDTITSATRGSASGSVLAILGDLSRVYVEGFVDETDVGRIKVGMPAEVTINSFPGRSFNAKIAKIYSQATLNQSVTTFQVDIELVEGGFFTRQTALLNSNPAGKESAEEMDSSQDEPLDESSEDSAESNPGGNDAGEEDNPGHAGKWKGRRGGSQDDGPVEVRVGMTADAQIIIRDIPDALIIPTMYVNFRADPPEVNLKDPRTGEHKPQPIELGFSDGMSIVVKEGLEEGDVIVRVPKESEKPAWM